MTTPTLPAILAHSGQLLPQMTDVVFPDAADIYGAICRSAAELSHEPVPVAFTWAREAEDALEWFLVAVKHLPVTAEVVGDWAHRTRLCDCAELLCEAGVYFSAELIGGAS